MQNITEYLYGNLCEASDAKIKELEDRLDKAEKDAEEAKKDAEEAKEDASETIDSEEDFRDYAENKFKEVFGDDLDEDRMNKVINGLLNDNKDLVDDGNWGELIGKLNKSFGS